MGPRVRVTVALLGLMALGILPAPVLAMASTANLPAPGPSGAALNPQLTATPALGSGSASAQPAPLAAGLYGEATPQAVNSAQSGQLRAYGSKVGQDWLKQTLGLDLQSMQIVWDPVTWSFVSAKSVSARGGGQAGAGPKSTAAPSDGSVTGKFTLQLEQSDDFTHLAEGLRDVPYNVEVKSAFRPVRSLSAIDTSLKIPLSPYDAWRADASMPMDFGPWWWRGLGLGSNLALHSGLNSRQGFNQVETGMRTQWTPGFWGPWNLDYAWDLHYGEGSGDSTNWLKFSKEF
ncbi:MAG TPA: hypothetical protein VK914_11330 [bacterium]|nr:hypothetical protein [bacterium]